MKKKSPIIELCKKVFAAEVLFIVAYNILILPYINAANMNFGTGMAIFSSSVAIIELQDLDFGVAYEGQKENIKIKPVDTNAAIFQVLGSADQRVKVNIVEKKIWLKRVGTPGTAPKDKIKVNKFKLGGDVNRRGKGTIPTNGVMADVRVGATAHVNKRDRVGSYLGQATLRVVYL